MMAQYISYLDSFSVTKISHKSVSFSGLFSGDMKISICNPKQINKTIDGLYNDAGELNCYFTGEMRYKFSIKDGNFCLNPEISEVNINSTNQNELDWSYFKIDVKNNNLWLTGALFANGWVDRNEVIKELPVESKIKKGICSSYCIRLDNIIKLINGKVTIKDLSKRVFNDCPEPTKSTPKPKPKKNVRSTKNDGNIGKDPLFYSGQKL